MEEYDDLIPEPDSDGGVDMMHQGWKRVDDIIWKMAMKILSLNLSFNKIEVIPEEIGDLILLKDLNIAHNQVEVLPQRLGDLRCLRKLQCQHNKIEKMPHEIGKCYMLEDLIAHDNMLRAFPASIIGCAALNSCDLRNNQLTSVPCELGGLVTMRSLELDGNEQMYKQIPSYSLADSFLCIFLLRMEYDQREELKLLRAMNLELEYKVREREEYNLRLRDEREEATTLVAAAKANFPKEYVKFKENCVYCKNTLCCCCNTCAIS